MSCEGCGGYYDYDEFDSCPPPPYDCQEYKNWKQSQNQNNQNNNTNTNNNNTNNNTNNNNEMSGSGQADPNNRPNKRPRPADRSLKPTCPSQQWYTPPVEAPPFEDPSWYDPELTPEDMHHLQEQPPLFESNTTLPSFNEPPRRTYPCTNEPPPPPPNTYTDFQPYRYPDPPIIPPAIPPRAPRCQQPPPPDNTNALFNDIGLPPEIGERSFEPPSAKKPFEKLIEENDDYEENVDSWFITPSKPSVFGCMDPTASNYNPLATDDDGSCIYTPPPIPGCMDPTANNYNPLATEDDGSCLYDPPPITCTTEWVEIASDGQTLTFSEQVDVAYGYDLSSDPPPAYKFNVTGPIEFSNTSFGSSFLGGVKKGWFRCAATTPSGEGQYIPKTSISPVTADDMIRSITNVSGVTGGKHDPDSIPWISTTAWNTAKWDGVPFDPTGKTKAQICAWFRPTGSAYVFRGIREKFYQVNPFADNAAPTTQEIENWNLEVIRHFRALLGITTPVQYNARLQLECTWSIERSRTRAWDTKYPLTGGNYGETNGPCFLPPPGGFIDVAGGHCGDAFFPNATDRDTYISSAPYNSDFAMYPELANYASRYSQTGGNVAGNNYIPWCIKLPTLLSTFICSDGLQDHTGPFMGRTEVGLGWYWSSSDPGRIELKGKWH